MAWYLEWINNDIDRLWPEGIPQIRNKNVSAFATCYAHDNAGNLIYLGMVGHQAVINSSHAKIQIYPRTLETRQRKKL